MTLILASSSPTRRRLLERAGIAVDAVHPDLDERAIEAPLLAAGAVGDVVALALAEAKALAVSRRRPGALVIGGDQTLRVDGEALHKPADLDAARDQLRRLSGRIHLLHTAIAIAREGAVLWRHAEAPALAMRHLDDAAIDRYLAEAGMAATASVGGYQIEGPGIRLFERIDGDYFAVLGLPLLPLLRGLRELGIGPI